MTPPTAAPAGGSVEGRPLLPLLAALSALGAATVAIYLPARPDAQAEFHASVESTGLTISLAGVAYAIGLFAYGPWSDRYGRRPAVLAGLALFLAGTAMSMLATSMTMLIVARAIQGFGSAAGITVGRAIVRDIYPAQRLAGSIAYLTMVVAVANAASPFAGGVITQFLHWRAVFATMLVASALITVWTIRTLPETLVAQPRHEADGALRTIGRLLARPAFFTCVTQSSVVFAAFLCFASTMPYVMKTAYGSSVASYGLWYALLPTGYFLGNYGIARYSARFGLRRLYRAGAVIQAVAAAAAFLLAWAHVWHPAAVFVPWMALTLGQGLILPCVTAAAVALAPAAAGTAAGLLGFLQQIAAAASVQATAGLRTDTPVPLALVVAVITTLSMAGALVSDAGLSAHAGRGE